MSNLPGVKSRLLGTAVAAAAVAAAAVLMPGAEAGPAPSTPHIGERIALAPGSALPRTNGGLIDSLNWSGYAVQPASGHAVTAVDTVFTVPRPTLATPGFAAVWTGIGGITTQDLIQAGVGLDPYNVAGSGAYFAWYEILPDAETPLTNCAVDPSCAVRPGDHVAVKILQVGAKRWSVNLNDYGRWTFSKTISYASARSSAEWILEAPTLVAQTIMPPLTNTTFGTGDTFSLDGGAPHVIGAGHPDEIDMVNLALLSEGTASALAPDGDGFTACTYTASCPRPAK